MPTPPNTLSSWPTAAPIPMHARVGRLRSTCRSTWRRRRPPSASSPTRGRGGDVALTEVVICNWRDLQHPEAGGSEHSVETVARILAADGHSVTILCAKVADRPADETRDRVRYLRAGGRFGVYLWAAWALLSGRVRPDVVVDVQNGLPWLSRLVTRKPVVVLLHHVHREQWPIVFGKLGSLGWLLESRIAPRVYRRSRYLTVSECTRAELAGQGIDPARVTVAYNGTPKPAPSKAARSDTPRVVVLGRLVPHKR